MKKIASLLLSALLLSSASAYAMSTEEFDTNMQKGIDYFNSGLYYEASDEFNWFADSNWGALNEGQQKYLLDYIGGTNLKINEIENRNNKKQKFKNRMTSLTNQMDNDNWNVDQRTMNRKMYQYYKDWDVLLNDIYNYLKALLPPPEFENIKNEQIDWIYYKESTAERDAQDWVGGSGYSTIYNSSLINSTRFRCYELINYIW